MIANVRFNLKKNNNKINGFIRPEQKKTERYRRHDFIGTRRAFTSDENVVPAKIYVLGLEPRIVVWHVVDDAVV